MIKLLMYLVRQRNLAFEKYKYLNRNQVAGESIYRQNTLIFNYILTFSVDVLIRMK